MKKNRREREISPSPLLSHLPHKVVVSKLVPVVDGDFERLVLRGDHGTRDADIETLFPSGKSRLGNHLRQETGAS